MANGYSALRKMKQEEAYNLGKIPNYYQNEKEAYRQALDLISCRELDENEKGILPDLFTSYGNMLDSLGRPVEALDYYNEALRINNQSLEALLNKAITLKQLSFRASGYTHLFILEAKRLFKLACGLSPHPQLQKVIIKHLDEINEFIDGHDDGFAAEKYEVPDPISEFHSFLRDFCVEHELYLTPSTLIGKKEHLFIGDPLFITQMKADISDYQKFDRYISFFIQIKQDYIFARYLLVQSQYKTKYAEVIDQDVDYYYPLDYSIYSSYEEMLKISYRLAVDTLDKIAFFVKDYCGISSSTTGIQIFAMCFLLNKIRWN